MATMVKTHDTLYRNGDKYEVMIADASKFVIAPVVDGMCDCENLEMYSNDDSILRLDDMEFIKQ